jgi:hypothetical protein
MHRLSNSNDHVNCCPWYLLRSYRIIYGYVFIDARFNTIPTGDTYVSYLIVKKLHIDYVDVYRRVFTTVKTWQIIMN